MARKIFIVSAFVSLLLFSGLASAQAPVWSNTLESDATSTVDGGEIVNPPSSYVPGSHGMAFAGNGSVQASWDNADVASIFDGIWDNDAGSTVDLYFRGDHWDTHSGDSGLWSVVDRFDGNDGYYIISVRDGSLRFPYKDSYSGYGEGPHLTGITLANDVTYRLTVRQYDTNFEVYLDGVSVYSDNTWSETIAFPQFNAGGNRYMSVGSRAVFGGDLQSGEWVDSIRVYNGYYTPSEIGTIPEPCTLLLLGAGAVGLLRRRRS
ncbi:MAG: PEP-CTERM sorting domain-containing protein [Planctomycetes bacterium]|nr:PEP-CTERM sorting domain-containing protein [Planctomycetota bacterium]